MIAWSVRVWIGLLGTVIFTARLCYADNFQLTDVTGYLPDLHFSLTADSGKAVREGDYRGDVVLLYFGFTGCSAQCPIIMTRLNRLMQQAGKNADHVQVLFVTVNPENDTPTVLHGYIQSFDAVHMAGLTGGDDAIEALAKRMRAAYRSGFSGSDPVHSDVVYVFDAHGHARLLITPDDADEKILHDIQLLEHAAG